MYTLYSIPGTCSTGINVLLNELEIDATITKRDDVENYRSLVPTNQVPALNVDGKILTEGANIALYLLQQKSHPILNHPDFNQWLMFNYATLHPAYSKLFTVNGVMGECEAKFELMQSLGSKVAELWEIVDARLETQEFMVGDSPSIVDYLLAIYLSWGNFFPDVKIPAGKNVVAHAEHIAQLPQFQRAYAKEGANFQIPKNAL